MDVLYDPLQDLDCIRELQDIIVFAMLPLIPPMIELTIKVFNGLQQRDTFNCGFLVFAFFELYVLADNDSGDNILATLPTHFSVYELAINSYLTFTKLYMANTASED